MQVGEVMLGAGRAFERFHVGLELDEIAGHETGRQTDMTQICTSSQAVSRQEPEPAVRASPRASARPAPCGSMIADQAVQALIELDKKIDGVARLRAKLLDQFLQARPRRLRRNKGRQVLAQFGRKRRTAISPA